MIEAKDLTKYYGSGEIRYDNEDITTFSDNPLTEFRRKNIAFIFQQYYLLPHMDVAQNVKMGADLSANKEYRTIIEAVGLGNKLHKYPSELSSGEQQRVSVARALAKSRRFYFWMNPQVRWMSRQEDRFSTTYPGCRRSTVLLLSWLRTI